MKEYLEFKDVQSFVWKAMESILTRMKKPEDNVVRNLLKILEALPKGKEESVAFLCDTKSKYLMLIKEVINIRTTNIKMKDVISCIPVIGIGGVEIGCVSI